MIVEDRYSFAPSVLAVSDRIATDAAEEARLHAKVRAAGGRLRAIVAPEQALAWLDEQAGVEAVLIDVAEDHGAVLDRLLERIDRDGGRNGQMSVVNVPAGLVDIAAARLADEHVALLADARDGDLVGALATALAAAGTSPELHDRDRDPVRLRQLSEEVGRIARALAELSGVDPGVVGAGEQDAHLRDLGVAAEPAGAISAAAVRAAIRGRRLRDQFFDSRLFADPAWDMLLDLMAARLEGRQVAVSSLCIAAAVPATTALRWIRTLVEEGLFVRVSDPRDGRRIFIELSDAAAAGLGNYFQLAARAGLPLG